ncbi:MAG TPA: hypothetical protein PK286_06555 [Devosia sp.]|nr:hypothetical protein [Devosia sp.]
MSRDLKVVRTFDAPIMSSTWAYTQVSDGTGFAYVFNLADANGTVIDPQSMGLPPDFPRNARHTVALRDIGGTELTMVEAGYSNEQLMQLSRCGLEECFDKMAAIFAN